MPHDRAPFHAMPVPTAATARPAQPQPDGSLAITGPDEQTLYDMGNTRLFATFDGRGNAVRVLTSEGYEGLHWSLALAEDGQPIAFGQARAIGRLWQLRSEGNGVNAALDTCLEAAAPYVYQRCTLANPGNRPQCITVDLDLSLAQPAGRRDRLRAAYARLVLHTPGLRGAWGRRWAKVALPFHPGRLVLAAGGRVLTDGRLRIAWQADPEPQTLAHHQDHISVHWELTLAPGESRELAWVERLETAEGDATAALAQRAAAFTAANEYARWLATQYHNDDPLLQSLFVAGLNCAVANFKEFSGDFGGLVAGPDYTFPPRLYFRDSYWTAQVLLRCRPDLVRRNLLALARGVHRDGQCPSGMFVPAWLRDQGASRSVSLDWLPDHYDAPAYFVLLLAGYVETTGDRAILAERVPVGAGDGPLRSLADAAIQAIAYLNSCDRDDDALIDKPYAANDWSDNVRRSVWVTYDQALYIAALRAAARLEIGNGSRTAAPPYEAQAAQALAALDRELWREDLGHYVNYKRPGYTEANLCSDTLIVQHLGLAGPERTTRVLAAARRLQTRYNDEQPYGDWGVMAVYPLYGNLADLFSKTAQPYHYHNGAEWPYWDGVYAAALLRVGDPDWRYVLTRWWAYSLEHGWLTPVEFYSPPYPAGGPLQGWSAMPAATLSSLK